jgi:hypothetical protein
MNDIQVSIDEVLEHLSPEGRLHFELASQRALIVRQQEALKVLSNGQEDIEIVEAV